MEGLLKVIEGNPELVTRVLVHAHDNNFLLLGHNVTTLGEKVFPGMDNYQKIVTAAQTEGFLGYKARFTLMPEPRAYMHIKEMDNLDRPKEVKQAIDYALNRTTEVISETMWT